MREKFEKILIYALLLHFYSSSSFDFSEEEKNEFPEGSSTFLYEDLEWTNDINLS